MAGALLVHGSEEQFGLVPITVPIRPIHSDARLSLLGIFIIGTVPFPPGFPCLHLLLGRPSRLFTI